MQLKINQLGGFDIHDTDTGDSFEFAGALLKLHQAVENAQSKEDIEQDLLFQGLALGGLYVKTAQVG